MNASRLLNEQAPSRFMIRSESADFEAIAANRGWRGMNRGSQVVVGDKVLSEDGENFLTIGAAEGKFHPIRHGDVIVAVDQRFQLPDPIRSDDC